MKANPMPLQYPDTIDQSNAGLIPRNFSKKPSGDFYKNRDDSTPVIVKTNTRLIFGFQSKPKVAWDLFIILTALYISISVPYYISFSTSTLSSTVIFAVHLFISLLFTLDILLSFRTTYLRNATSEEIKNSKLITKHYALSLQFALDLISVIPFELLTPSNLGLLRVLKISKLYRLSNMISVIRIRNKLKVVFEFLLILLILFLFVHFSACVFYIIINSQKNWIPPEDYPNNQTDFFERSTAEQYWTVFYHSVEFVAGIQNGGETKEQLIFFTAFYIIGTVLMAILLGNITLIIRTLKNEDTLFSKTQTKIFSAMKKLRLPGDVKSKVNEFFIANYNGLKFGKEYEKFIELLPPSLVKEVNTYYLASIINKNPIIAGNKKVMKFALVRLESLMVHPGVKVISQFDQYSNLYFVAQGIFHVEVVDEEHNLNLVNILQDGDHFGEISMLFKSECTATVTSAVYSSLAFLSPTNFSELLDIHPKTSENLMSKIISYHDSWTVFCKSTLKAIPYLANCDKVLISQILHSLTQERYETEEVIINIGDKIDFIYLVLEGELEFYTYIHDKTLNIFLNDSFNLQELDTQKESRVLFPLGSIKTGSILFHRQALTRPKSLISIRVTKGAHLLKLPTDFLESLSRDRPSLNSAISQYKSTLFKYDSTRRESLPLVFPIDTIRNEKYASGCSKAYWTGCLKLKNTVLKIIEVKRNSKIVNFWSVKRMVRKIKAINYAEGMGRHDLVRLIANDQVSDDAVKVLDLLEEGEMNQHLLMQFALKANESAVVCEFLAGRIKSCRKKIRRLKDEYEEVNTLASLVEKVIIESIRLTKK